MGNSLQDQLLKAGLVDEKQARKARAGKAPKKRGRKGRQEPVTSESAAAVQQAAAEKAVRDRALDRQRKAESERKALTAQIRQLVEQHRLPREDGDIGYHFVDAGKVRKLFVTRAIQERLGKGLLAIVRLNERYEVVPTEVAEKIRARDAASVVVLQASSPEPAEDDPYRDFQVPDDLMW